MPTTTGKATDLITFSRGTLATVTDANGRIVWAPHNLLLASEQFDASSWTKSNVTVTANYAAAPNGTTTADRVVYAGGLGTPAIRQISQQLITGSNAGLTFTFGIWLSGTGKVRIRNTQVAILDTYSADITLTATPTLYTLTVTNGSSAATEQSVGVVAVAADTAFDAVVWGAHLYRADLGGMQSNASAYPYYNPSTPRNILAFSEDWSNVNWVKTNILAFGSGSTVNATAAPNGSLSADLIVPNTTSGVHTVDQTSYAIVNNTPYTSTVYVKAAGYSKVGLADNAAANRWSTFSLSGSGSVIANGASATGAITALSDGWYRISLAENAGTTALVMMVYVLSDGYASGNPASYSYAGNGTSGIYLWGAQLSDSASLDAYSPVFGAAPSAAAAHGPRLDYRNGSALGLLVEEARTNLVLRSAEFDNASWFKARATVTANAVISPDGTLTADTLVEDNTTNSHPVYQPVASLTTQAYTFSVYLKAAGRSKAVLALANTAFSAGPTVAIDLVAVTAVGALGGSGTITAVGDGWYRCTITATAGAAGTGDVYIQPANAAGATNYLGTSSDALYMYGAQLEAGSFATSYIPTAAATVTRNADVASVGVSQFPYSASEGTLVVSGSFISLSSTSVAVMASLSNNASSNSINIYRQSASMLLNTIASGSAGPAYTVSANTDPVKAAFAYKLNDMNAAVNGTAQTTNTSGAVPTGITRLDIGNMWNVDYKGAGWIRQITYLPRRLSNSELAARTL